MADLRNSLYGTQYDRYVERSDEQSSTMAKLQKQYWEAKQAFIRKLKRKEDDCIVASDAELDSKLELFRSIEESCTHLLCILEGFQDRICALAHEESITGRFLKDCGNVDKTRAGKMLTASGKTLCYSAQQRIHLRNPLVRLYQEVETFQLRAITDTLITIEKMEKQRIAYRGALLWMKDVSEQLDPDTFKQLEKFRKVQGHVRRCKSRFDKFKLDTLQKIDMLSASRCNMYSHSLAYYQTALLQFWEKTSKTMLAVADNFKGYQYYEFNMLKELTEPSRKLANETSSNDELKDIFVDDKDKLIFFDPEYHDDDKDNKQNKGEENFDDLLDLTPSNRKQENLVNFQDLMSKHLSDDLTILEDILNTSASTSLLADDFKNLSNFESDDSYLPSQLLGTNFNDLNLLNQDTASKPINTEEKNPKTVNKSDPSDWFNLFAELDPLSNPDLIGVKGHEDRNC